MISAILLALASAAPTRASAGASVIDVAPTTSQQPPSSQQQPSQPTGVPFRPPQAGPGATADGAAADGSKPAPRTTSIEDEVLANVKNESVGAATVADMGYPDEYLRRVGDRIVRSSFEARYRVVVPDPKPQGTVSTNTTTAAPASTTPKSEPASSSRGFVIAAIVAVVLGLLYLVSTRGSRGGAS